MPVTSCCSAPPVQETVQAGISERRTTSHEGIEWLAAGAHSKCTAVASKVTTCITQGA